MDAACVGRVETKVGGTVARVGPRGPVPSLMKAGRGGKSKPHPSRNVDCSPDLSSTHHTPPPAKRQTLRLGRKQMAVQRMRGGGWPWQGS